MLVVTMFGQRPDITNFCHDDYKELDQNNLSTFLTKKISSAKVLSFRLEELKDTYGFIVGENSELFYDSQNNQ